MHKKIGQDKGVTRTQCITLTEKGQPEMASNQQG